MNWIKLEPPLPPYKTWCAFKSEKGYYVGFVTYFEHGDSELRLYGKGGLPHFFGIFQNCDTSSIDLTITHYQLLDDEIRGMV